MFKIRLKQKLNAEKAELPPPSLKGVKARDPQQQCDYQIAKKPQLCSQESRLQLNRKTANIN
eukprot:9114679-Heterocapsa_arctica.AAC.1